MISNPICRPLYHECRLAVLKIHLGLECPNAASIVIHGLSCGVCEVDLELVRVIRGTDITRASILKPHHDLQRGDQASGSRNPAGAEVAVTGYET